MSDPARIDGLDGALRVLAPALERFATERPATPLVAYDGSCPPLPSAGVGLDAMLAELVDLVGDGCRIGMPGWFGFITTAPTAGPAAATAAAAVAGSQRYLHHSFNHLEHLALAWLAELCGVPEPAAGVFTSGGSTANLLALGAARQAAFERDGHDAAELGNPHQRVRIYASERAHRTIHRSAAVLGLGRASVCALGTDTAGHVDVDDLRQRLDDDRAAGVLPLAIVAIAGSTDTGSIDDIATLAQVARQHDVWLHVDGAYGLIARCCPEVSSRFAGVELADSWIVDPHKWLACGTGVGAVYVRDGDLLTRAFAEGHAAYLEGTFAAATGPPISQFDGLAGAWSDQSVELSAPTRGAAVWAVLREIGRDGVVERVRRDIGFASALADRVRAEPELDLLCEPELSIVCFRYVADGARPDDELDALNARIAEQLRRTATVPSTTVVDGRFALRPCFINPRTAEADVDALVDTTLAIGRSFAAAP